jgi:type IV pilus assembly protein PilB
MPAQLLNISPKPLGQLLLGRGVIRAEQLDRALEAQRRGRHRKLLGEILVDLQDCTEQQVAESLAEAYGIPYARLHARLADPKALAALPADFIEKRQVLPLFCVDGVLTVAVSEPANVFLIEEIERASGRAVQIVAATAGDIRATLRDSLRGESGLAIETLIDEVSPDAFQLIPPPQTRGPGHAAAGAAGKLLHFCLYSAAKEGATAVHFEPLPKSLRIRYRIDGRLAAKMHPPLRLHEPLVACLKLAAGMDPAQCRLPQHGQVGAVVDGRNVTFHASTAPGRCGETLVVRLVETDKAPASLETLGFSYDMLKQWRRLLSRPDGLVLVSGPADSGKRTTLYSSLAVRNQPGANLCTIEEIICLAIPGVNQFQLDPATGFNTDAALEAVLRQSPDVMLISDLADGAAARLAVGAALDGRFVLAGLRAHDTPRALSGLCGLGVEAHRVASSVAAVLAQRLVRKLCRVCREAYEPAGAEKRRIEKLLPGVKALYRPKGCDRCRQTGYSGRVGLFELLVPDDGLIDGLSQGAPLSELRRLATAAGLTSLKVDGLEKACAGITPIDEVERVVG